jgi:hypothetical protein
MTRRKDLKQSKQTHRHEQEQQAGAGIIDQLSFDIDQLSFSFNRTHPSLDSRRFW